MRIGGQSSRLEIPPRKAWSASRLTLSRKSGPTIFRGKNQMNVNGRKGLRHGTRMANRAGIRHRKKATNPFRVDAVLGTLPQGCSVSQPVGLETESPWDSPV